jgi:lipoate-protein ligase A
MFEPFHTALRSLPWRIVPETPLPAAVNVALDEVPTPPTVRFWKWTEPAVILGRSQSVANEIDLEAARHLGLRVVRRFSGGGTMFIEPEGAITYSMVLPEAVLAGHSIRQSYELCDAWAVEALRELGIECHYAPINDIACRAGKIAGAAQARRRGTVIHHTTIAYSMDTTAMQRVLRIGKPGVSPRGVRSAEKIVAPLNLQTGRSREAVVQHLLEHFHHLYGGVVEPLTPTETDAAVALAEAKYSTEAWTHEVP